MKRKKADKPSIAKIVFVPSIAGAGAQLALAPALVHSLHATSTPREKSDIIKFTKRILKEKGLKTELVADSFLKGIGVKGKLASLISTMKSHYEPAGDKITSSFENRPIAYHEAGHARAFNATSKPIRFARTLAYTPLTNLLTVPLLFRKARAGIAGKDKKSIRHKIIDTIEKHPALLGASAYIPRMVEEAMASGFALHKLRKLHGFSKALKGAYPLAMGALTHAATAIPLALTTHWIIRRQQAQGKKHG